MSSTNRGMKRNEHDFYATPLNPIREFLTKFLENNSLPKNALILEPSSGGDKNNPMAYPTVLNEFGFDNLITMDIREESPAKIKGNYLLQKINFKPDMIITNPPFNQAFDFVKKALNDVKDGGYVVMLLRLNFLESKTRFEFFKQFNCKYIYVHHKRISFTANNKTDSIAYAHFVWQKGNNPDFAKITVI